MELKNLGKIKTQKIGKTPVVILPLNDWLKIEIKLEDLEMMQSRFLRKKIAKIRAEKKIYSSDEAKKMFEI